jgi:hypothetical protein
MKFLNAIVILSALSINICWAGPSVGGGGDVVILPDDSVVLADPFMDGGAIQPNNMPPLRALNPRILQLINLYKEIVSPMTESFSNGKNDINNLLEELGKRKNNLRFYAVQTVEELNLFCASGGRKIYKLPNGAQVQQVACTAGEETFLIEPVFVQLSLRDQTLLLVHERLTTLRDQYGGKNYSAIARFTTGLNTFLNVYAEQTKNNFRILNTNEQKTLTEFYTATEEIEKRDTEVTADSFQWQAHANGGGRVHFDSNVDQSAIVSVRSLLGRGSSIGPNAKVINLKNSRNSRVVLGDNSLLLNSEASVRELLVGTNTVIKNTALTGDQVTLGSNSNFQDSRVYLVDNKSWRYYSVKFADNQKLNSNKIDWSTMNEFYPKGITAVPLNKEVTIASATIKEEDKESVKFKKKDTYTASALNANGDGYTIKGLVTDVDYHFKDGSRDYTLKNVTVKVTFNNFKRNADANLLTVNGRGEIVSADYSKIKPMLNVCGRGRIQLLSSTGLLQLKNDIDYSCNTFDVPLEIKDEI